VKQRTTSRTDERGAVMVLAAAGMVMAMIMAALAVDLGIIAQEARRNQKVADMAAMDAAWALTTDPTAAAKASALRNGFSSTSPPNFVVETGTVTAGVFSVTPLASATAVRVTATSPHKNLFPFVSGGQSVVRKAVATDLPMGGFSIGSSLATFDTSRSAILDRFMGRIVKGSNLSAGLVSWSGLAGANVTLDALRTQLATAGFTVGNVNQLMDADLTLTQLMTATAGALTAQGVAGTAQAALLNTLKAQVTSSSLATFKLGKFMTVSQGADNMALGSSVNVFQLVTAAAQVANGSNFIDVSDVGITVPGALSTKASLQVIQAPQFYFGAKGGSVSTSQIDLTVTPSLDMPITVAGLVGAHVKNDLPIHVTGAGAVGTLADVTCGATSGITVTADPNAFSGSAATSLDVYANVVLLGDIPVLKLPTTSVVPNTDGGATDLSFSYPTEFPPPLGTATTKHAGSQPVGLSGIMTFTVGTPQVLNVTAAAPALQNLIVSTTKTALSTLVGQVDSLVLTPLLQALGTDIGSADVMAMSLKCGTPTLIG
jgi:uncharacterized membrane protein